MRAGRPAFLPCASLCALLCIGAIACAAAVATGGPGATGGRIAVKDAETDVLPLLHAPVAALTEAPSPSAPGAIAAPDQPSPSAIDATTPPPAAIPPLAVAAGPPVLRDNQVIVYYGTPLAAGLGILGALEPEQAALQVADRARTYDGLNGDRGAVGALDVIYSLAQAEPTPNGMYIRYLEDFYIEEYLRIAEEHDLELFLDLQIGRARILDEVRGVERFLLNPRVHIAIDPEYAVGPEGVPVATPGSITGGEINAVQVYLRDLVARYGLPGKMLVVHQYMEDTIVDAERVETVADIDFVLNMDALGGVKEKKEKYEHFSSRSHSKHDAFNVFFIHDQRVLSEEEILGLSPVPSIVFYQ
jgi:hypothetical protein